MGNQVHYHVIRATHGQWQVLRERQPIIVRRDLFEAVDLATRFAEREALVGTSRVKVTWSRGLSH
ncbi:hypothetical protein [Dyella koreensis]|uniref:DUF2188 domain-containing protein n=1 Tax=Dyella koreensis TaxID=311235 RepID=A0ABW8K7M6_9GAMM